MQTTHLHDELPYGRGRAQIIESDTAITARRWEGRRGKKTDSDNNNNSDDKNEKKNINLREPRARVEK